ncbi:unnamed protein product [Euphydryas editha]|uniref:Uncharacterized protein n=1 Tax=Euphydryas editha TaxID=104508 RepID=A0AAU9TEK3_EUPED|nr:unnamed protein product [Euphydryas editha]
MIDAKPEESLYDFPIAAEELTDLISLLKGDGSIQKSAMPKNESACFEGWQDRSFNAFSLVRFLPEKTMLLPFQHFERTGKKRHTFTALAKGASLVENAWIRTYSPECQGWKTCQDDRCLKGLRSHGLLCTFVVLSFAKTLSDSMHSTALPTEFISKNNNYKTNILR